MKLLYLKSGDRRAGICSYVMQVIVMAKVCKEQNIPMYVDFSEHMLYYKNGNITDNVWEYFFEQPCGNLNLNDYEREEAVWYQDNRPLPVLYRFTPDSEWLREARGYCREFVKIRPELLEIGNSFIKKHTNQNYLAVHKRGCDGGNAGTFKLEHHFIEVDKYIDAYEQLLVCSDEEFSVDAFKQRYGSKVISYNSARETDPACGHRGVHFRSNDDNFVYRNGRDCIIESYLMSKSAFLLNGLSNVTHFAIMQSDDLKFIRIDENYNSLDRG